MTDQYRNPFLRGMYGARNANEVSSVRELGQLQGILALQDQMGARQAAMQQQQNLRGVLSQLTDPAAQMLAQAGDIKGALARQFPDQAARFDKINPSQYTPESLNAFTRSGSHADLVPVRKREGVTTRDETGAPVTAFIDPYAQNAPMAQPVKNEMVNLGGSMAPVNPYTQNAPMRRTVSPDAQLGASVSMRGQNMVDARSREQAGREQFGAPVEVTGPGGAPMFAVQNKVTGRLHDANTMQPVAGVGPKVGETAQKQQVGVQSTKDAIGEYRSALQSFGVTDIANPNARARMGTIYNNMLLQAKEAYNLGVLNGPDYQILQEVITNPASFTGAITSKRALDDQARKLDDIMGRVGGRVTQTQSGVGRGASASWDGNDRRAAGGTTVDFGSLR